MSTDAWIPTQPHTRLVKADVIAGLSVALMLVPQSMAYAELAGLPPYIGLFASALPPIFAAFAASSPYLQTGPVALTSLLTFGALAEFAEPGSANYLELAALLALVVGVSRLVLGILRMGVIAYLMSEPVLIGFTSAASILIIGSQLPNILGIKAPEGDLLGKAWWSIRHTNQWEIDSLIISLITIVLVLGRRLYWFFPGSLVAVTGGVLFSHFSNYDGSIIGDIPSGFPNLSFELPWSSTGSLLVSGVTIALVGFAEPASISRVFAISERQSWNADREFFSQGLANIAAAFSGSFPVGGSFSRSSLNHLSGAKSRWSGLVTGVAVLFFLPLASILEPLPHAVLGGIVIAAVIRLVKPVELIGMMRKSKPQTFVSWGTFIATLLFTPRIERGVITGIILSLALHLWRELRIEVPRKVDGTILYLKPHGVLWFATAARLERAVLNALVDEPEIRTLVISLGGCGRVDFTAAMTLNRISETVKSAGLEVQITEIPKNAIKHLKKFT